MKLTDRISHAWRTFRTIGDEPADIMSLADPYRLFGKNERLTPYNPNELIGRRGIRTIYRMRRDEQVKAALLFKKNAVVAAGWEVVSPVEQDGDWDVTTFVRNNLMQMDGTLDRALINILSGLDFGFSVSEKTYEKRDDRIWLRGIRTRYPDYWHFRQDEYGRITELLQDQRGSYVPMPPEKFVVFSYQNEFDNPYGTPDLEAAYRAWWSKENAYKWFLMYLERFGIPPIFGLYDQNKYTPAQIDDLKDILTNMQAATVGAMPAGEDNKGLNLWSPDASQQTVGEAFIRALDRFDTDIARAILMPGLLGVSPEQQTGSQARARVVFDMFMLVVEQLREEITKCVVNEQIVRPLVDLNFNVTEYPEWRPLPLSDDDKIEIFKAWGELLEKKAVERGDEDENHIRAALGMPLREVTDDEFEPDDDDPLVEDEPMEEAEMMKAFAMDRQPTRYERRVNFRQIERDLDALEATLVGEVSGIMERARDDVIRRLERAADVESVQVESLPGVPALRRAFRAFLMDAFDLGRDQLRSELQERQNKANVNPKDALEFLRRKALELAATKSEEVLGKVRQALVAGIQNGDTTGQVMERIRKVFQPFIEDTNLIRDDKTIEPYRLAAIARTESTAAFNQGRLIQARAARQIMRGMQYSAILDGRTSNVCRLLDGKIFRLDDPRLDNLRPPRHVNCRSVLVPVTISQPVDEGDFISPSEAGRAQELSGDGF